jgi:hypothetical protein
MPVPTTHTVKMRNKNRNSGKRQKFFFMFPSLHPDITHAISDDISLVWFKE